MVQGIGREYIFPDDKFKGFYVNALRKNQKEYPVKILAFCIMGSRAHIWVSVEDAHQMSGYFKCANADYARITIGTRELAMFFVTDTKAKPYPPPLN